MIDARPFERRLPTVLHQLGVGTWTGAISCSNTLTKRLMVACLQHLYTHTRILSLICNVQFSLKGVFICHMYAPRLKT